MNNANNCGECIPKMKLLLFGVEFVNFIFVGRIACGYKAANLFNVKYLPVCAFQHSNHMTFRNTEMKNLGKENNSN